MCFVSLAQKKTVKGKTVTGTASYYSDDFHGKKTFNGEKLSQQKLTCASNQYKIGTWLRVTNIKSGKSVVVQVNDRMGKGSKRIVDLTRRAAKQIGILGMGICKVAVENLGAMQP